MQRRPGADRFWSETASFDIGVAGVARPPSRHRIEVGGDAYLVQGEPVRDSARLV